MSSTYSNPFASCEGVLGKDHLIGREVMLQNITDWIRRGRNLSLYGMLHIGKSSVLHAAIIEQKQALHRENILPILINLPSWIEANQGYGQFFRILVEQCMEELEELGMVSTTIEEAAEKALQEGFNWGYTRRFFKRVRETHLRIIFILEKFDYITKIFQNNVTPFSMLQELSSSITYNVRFITESLCPLKEIVPKDPTISNFTNGFDPHCLSPFDEQDMNMYFERLASTTTATHTFPVTFALQEQVHDYCGGHPYLLVKLGYELAEHFLRTGQVDIEQAIQNVEMAFLGYMDDLKDSLHPEQLDTLVRITNGTKNVAARDNVAALERYGLIRPNLPASPSATQPPYTGFSLHFQNHLQISWGGTESDPFSWSHTMLPEDLFLNRYKIVGQAKTTGHSQVAKAWDTQLHRSVALKRLSLSSKYGEEAIKIFKERLEREAKILARIIHPNIGMVYDSIKDPPTIVMQWVEGKPLDQTWEHGNGLPAIKVIRLGIKLAKALDYIHNKKPQVIHRDIKPENIIVQEDGEPILIDFDIARTTGGIGTIIPYDEQGNASFSVWTPGYGAPEQSTSPINVTDRADIYALGLVLYETLTGGDRSGLSPHRETPQHSKISAPLWQIFQAMLSEDPHDRPGAGHLCQMLEHCLQALENA